MGQGAEGITRRQIQGLSSPPFYSWYHLSFGLPFLNMAGHKVFCDGPASLVSLIVILQLLWWGPRWNLWERPRQMIRWKLMVMSIGHAMFWSSPTCSSLFLPSSWWVLICDVPHFRAHQLAPPSFSPPDGESLFVTCHILKLTNPLLPLPPLQQVSPRLWCAMFQSSPTHSSLFLLFSKWVLIYNVPHFKAHQPAPPSFPPLVSESPFMMCHISKLTNPLLLPPLQSVSPCLWWCHVLKLTNSLLPLPPL